ncbi:probable strigolactone esterase DAD2 [Lycium ferocissimum]|uniref:probable strigolactone esterase DAD2 n=1 Tax=Lycium ferocissimum TaxID=112874 RepID=UPI0028159742|nr:probable strigolactone esterase DAD2 [Lycium ferocissimum]
MVILHTLSTKMNATMVGSGKETIILAHGYGGDQSVWDKILPKLCECYQILLFDWSFSGSVKDHQSLFDTEKYSSYEAFADDLIGLVDEMKLDSSIFVGHSMSGIIGCIASIKRPHLFKRLILVASSPRFINLDDYEGGFEIGEMEEMFKNIEEKYEVWSSNFARIAVDPSDPPSVEKFEKSLKRMGVEVGLPLAKNVFMIDYRGILDKVITPCAIIQCKTDFAVPNSVATFMHNNIKGESTVEIINTRGHFPQLTAHEEFLDVIHRVLAS